MKDGLLDVRTRDNKRHGKIRVDEIARMLESERPIPSSSNTNFYKNIWKPETYGFTDASSQSGAKPKQENGKLEEIEQVLAQGQQWLSGANLPGAADAEALQAIKDCKPDPISYPHAFAWLSLVSKFSPEK